MRGYHYRWAWIRKNVPLEMRNFHRFKKFTDVLQQIDIDKVSRHLEEHPGNGMLIYNEGSPCFDYFRLSPHGEHINHFTKHDLWLDVEPDEKILDKFPVFSSKYNTDEIVSTYENYRLFFMQDSSTHNVKGFVSALRSATKHKKLTLFKGHPVSPIPAHEIWEWAKQEGLVSEYSVFVMSCPFNLIKNADCVISDNSTMNLTATLMGKPSLMYRPNEYWPLSHIIEDDNFDVPIISNDIIIQYLTWYYHVFCIDTNNPLFPVKIERIINQFKQGLTFKEIFSYENHKRSVASYGY